MIAPRSVWTAGLLLAAASILSPVVHADTVAADGKKVTDGPFKDTEIIGGRIYIKFTPHQHTSPCTKIVFIQVVKDTGIDATGKSRPLRPVHFKNLDGSDKLDKDTIEHEGKAKHVDYKVGEKDPYYNGDDPADKGDGVAQGSKNGGVTAATTNDGPTDHPDNWPADIQKVIEEFETVAFCAAGADVGHVFGVLKWQLVMERGKPDALTITSASSVTGPPNDAVDIIREDGTNVGTYQVYSPSAPGQPSENFWRALREWTTNHKFRLPGIVATPPYGPPIPPNWAFVKVPGMAEDSLTLHVSEPASLPADATLAGLGFELSGFGRQVSATSGSSLSAYPFGAPYVAVVHYGNAQVSGLDEDGLALAAFDNGLGQYTTDGISVLERDPSQNSITFLSTRLGTFAILGPSSGGDGVGGYAKEPVGTPGPSLVALAVAFVVMAYVRSKRTS